MYRSRTISCYEHYRKDGSDETLHVRYDGYNEIRISRRTGTASYHKKSAEVVVWTQDPEAHELAVRVARGQMPYAVFADYVEERRFAGHLKERHPGDLAYVLAEMRSWPAS